MVDLSRAAQAVLDAFGTYPLQANHIAEDMVSALAAALRAAADQLFETEILPPGYAYSAPAEMWHYEFRLKSHRNLYAIAAELEAQ